MERQFDNEPIDFIDPNKKYRYESYSKSKGFTLLMKWCLLYHRDPAIIDRIADYLRDHPEAINQKNHSGSTPLMVSCRNSQTVSSNAIVTLLIACGADLDAQDNKGWTALMISCKNYNNGSSIETIKLLIDSNACVNIRTVNGHVLHTIFPAYDNIIPYIPPLSMGRNDDEILKKDIIVKMLIEAGIDTTDQHDGQSILHHNISLSSCRMLLEAGAHININVKNNRGNTPLLSNIRWNPKIDIINLYLDYGADPNIKDIHGKTSIDNSYGDIREFLLNYQPLPEIKEPEC